MVVVGVLWRAVAAGLRLWWRFAMVCCLLLLAFVFAQVLVASRTLRAFRR